MHTPGAQASKSVHPAAKMCTLGAGCTLKNRQQSMMVVFVFLWLLPEFKI